MSDLPQHSRRQLLSWFAAVPFLPLGAMATTTMLAGCNDSNDDVTPAKPINLKTATFTAMAAPSLLKPSEMATTTVGSTLSVNWDDGSKTDYKLAYKTFFKTGDKVSDGKGGQIIAGGYFDINNKPIIDKSVVGKERQFFSDAPDGSSLLKLDNAKVDGVKGNPVFAVVQFEYATRNQALESTYGQLPSPIAVITLDQDPKTGHLELVKYHNVDTSKVNGLWITCGASLSPWGTHLSSEEYEPDAFDQGALGNGLSTLKAYSKNVYGDESSANPYNYGHLPEVTVNPDGTGSIVKHYNLGRISHELIQVMPDNRTALMGDDATNGGFFMFVADKEKDLSSGSLYVAQYTTELNETSSGKISWIKLGSATSNEIETLVKNNIKAIDIIDSIAALKVDLEKGITQEQVDAQKQTLQNSGYKKVYLNKTAIWLKAKAGQDKAAAFLETHRYAALKGGSLAFTKMEGTTVNIKDKKAYSAISAIKDSMVKDGKGWSASNNVTFQKAIASGGVLEHTLVGSQKDTDGNTINSEWVPASSQFILLGEDLATPDSLGNTANADKLGNPDNLKFSESLRTLFIGEDSGMHVNNFLWAYNVDSKQLARILSTPSGAESTGLHAVDSINGWTYIMSNFQHPGDWEPIHNVVQPTLDPLIRANWNDRFSAAVGYLTADPIAPSVVKK